MKKRYRGWVVEAPVRRMRGRATVMSKSVTEEMAGVEGPLQGLLSTEALREVNDRLAAIQSRAGDGELTLLCECAGPLCVEQVAVERRRFMAMRESGEAVLSPLHR
jgi:hypothetical protein